MTDEHHNRKKDPMNTQEPLWLDELTTAMVQCLLEADFPGSDRPTIFAANALMVRVDKMADAEDEKERLQRKFQKIRAMFLHSIQGLVQMLLNETDDEKRRVEEVSGFVEAVKRNERAFRPNTQTFTFITEGTRRLPGISL